MDSQTASHNELSSAEEIRRVNDEDYFASMTKAFQHAINGEREALLGTLDGPCGPSFWSDPEFCEWIVGWLMMVGEKEKALDWLERWIDRGSFNYPMLAHGDPLLEPLRGELRFRRLLDRIRPEWERFVPRFQP